MKERVLIMKKKTCVAMLLAGGQGSRLGVLTKKVAKPAVPYGGKYRIIDFPLSNCTNSGIDTVGVLTQYMPLELNSYIGSGAPWDLDLSTGGVFVLPPYQTASSAARYFPARHPSCRSACASSPCSFVHIIHQISLDFYGFGIFRKVDFSQRISYLCAWQNSPSCAIMKAVQNVDTKEVSHAAHFSGD